MGGGGSGARGEFVCTFSEGCIRRHVEPSLALRNASRPGNTRATEQTEKQSGHNESFNEESEQSKEVLPQISGQSTEVHARSPDQTHSAPPTAVRASSGVGRLKMR